MTEDFYYTIKETKRIEFKEKKSRFIATALHIDSKESAMEELDKVKREFHDARHNCYAYRIGEKGLEFRSSDDGEPSGTAGKPILFAEKKYELSDVLVVVTRFFGGVKLGKGGLARAYGEAAELVLQEVEKVKVDITKRLKVFCTYEEINFVKRHLNEYAVSFEEIYTDVIDITAEIPRSKVEEFCEILEQKTLSKAGWRIIN